MGFSNLKKRKKNTLLLREGYVISLLLLLVRQAIHLMFLRKLVERLIHMLIFHLYRQRQYCLFHLLMKLTIQK
ncbi:hypothetical protein C6355_17440 [Bacillus velezensis]|nr:hypothetical protein C6355_17440 [Bacillus velezensis]